MKAIFTLTLLLLATTLTSRAADPARAGVPVTGKLVDTAGKPVPNATVKIFATQAPLQTVTAAPDGTFSFPAIPPGDYALWATTPTLIGHAKLTIKDLTTPVDPLTITLDPKANVHLPQ